jgi:hypothetical protein
MVNKKLYNQNKEKHLKYCYINVSSVLWCYQTFIWKRYLELLCILVIRKKKELT